jgi:hypothetical protein
MNLDDRFDITRSYPHLSYPPKPNFDVDAIQALMVEASFKAEAIKARNNDPNIDPITKDFAIFNLLPVGKRNWPMLSLPPNIPPSFSTAILELPL